MKILLTGATGVVGTECIRIALGLAEVTELVAIARRPVSIPAGVAAEADQAKLKTVIVEDFGVDYSPEVKEQLEGADACIWNLAITPTKAKAMTLEEAKRISHDFTLTGLHSIMSVVRTDQPFRFIYTSGALTIRDQDRKDSWIIPEYRKMRGAVESALLSEVTDSKGRLQVVVTKPAYIHHARRGTAEKARVPLAGFPSLPRLHVSEVAAAELDQAINGVSGPDTLEATDLGKIGRDAMKRWDVQESC